MEPNSIVSEFKAALSNSEEFEISQVTPFRWHVASAKCLFEFTFDPREEGFNLTVRKTGAPESTEMAFWVLRHLRGAYDPGRKTEDPSYCAELCNRFFPDLLAGDFSIQIEYARIRSAFFDKMILIRRLPDLHPARIKYKQFDIRWMDEI